MTNKHEASKAAAIAAAAEANRLMKEAGFEDVFITVGIDTSRIGPRVLYATYFDVQGNVIDPFSAMRSDDYISDLMNIDVG